MTTMPSMKLKIEAGLIVRGAIKRNILSRARLLGLEIQVSEDKGLLESVYTFEATGPLPKLSHLAQWVKSYMENFEDGTS